MESSVHTLAIYGLVMHNATAFYNTLAKNSSAKTGFLHGGYSKMTVLSYFLVF